MPTNFLIGFNGDPSAGATPPQTNSQTFNKATYGVISGNTLTPIHLVAAGDHLTLITARGRTNTFGVPAAAVLGVYVTDAAGTVHGAKVAGNYTTATTLVDTGTAATVSTAPIDFDLTPWAGQYIKLAYGHDTLWRRAVHNSVSDSSVTSTGDLADPFGTPTNNIYIPAMWMTITRPDANSIDSVNGDDELVAAAANTAEVTGYDDGVNPIISGTVGSLALSSVSQTGTTVSFTIPSPVNNSYYPEPDEAHTLTLTDGVTPADNDYIMRFADYTSVVVASAVLGDLHYLGGWTTSEPQDGDRFVYDPLFWTVAADGSYTGATEGPSTIWLHWRSSDSKIFAYQSTVSDGVIVSGGLSVTGLSVTGLSVRGLAVRGLGGAAAMAGGFPYLLPFLLS